MTEPERKRLRVNIEHGEFKIELEGTPEEMSSALLQFFTKTFPSLEIVKKLTLTIEWESLLKELEKILAFSPEGAVVLLPRETQSKLSIRDLIVLHLVKVATGHFLGKLQKASLSVDEILSAIGGRIGATAGRLSELVDEGIVARIGRGEYKATTFGITHFMQSILPKLKDLVKEVGGAVP